MAEKQLITITIKYLSLMFLNPSLCKLRDSNCIGFCSFCVISVTLSKHRILNGKTCLTCSVADPYFIYTFTGSHLYHRNFLLFEIAEVVVLWSVQRLFFFLICFNIESFVFWLQFSIQMMCC